MAVSQAQKLAVRKYRRNNYETVSFEVRKGIREEYKQAAERLGLSLAEFFKQAAESYGANHGGEIIHKPEAEKLTAEERRLLAAFAKLPKNAQTNLIKTLEALSPKKEG
ncbi:MAG: hypothetical protein IJQ01_02645 [Selenomonadaceae bacterium]|nr:hypothetical protein [Selenomonadaceae bacterium]